MTIALMYDMSGYVDSFQDGFREAFQKATDDASVRYPGSSAIKYVHLDSKCMDDDDDVPRSAALSAVANEAQIVIGPICSANAKAANSILGPSGVPMIGIDTTAASLGNDTAYPHFFRVVATDEPRSIAMANVMYADGVRNVCFLTEVGDYGDGIVDRVTSSFGGQVATRVNLASAVLEDAQTVTETRTAFESAGCDGIFTTLFSQNFPSFLTAFADSAVLNALPKYGSSLQTTNTGQKQALYDASVTFPIDKTASGAMELTWTATDGHNQDEAYEALSIGIDALQAYHADPAAMSLSDRVLQQGTGRTPSALGAQFDFLPNGDYAGSGYRICQYQADLTTVCTREWTQADGLKDVA
jgi:ABC-type branched-subunit amino acid transport system substrate-binding protein